MTERLSNVPALMKRKIVWAETIQQVFVVLTHAVLTHARSWSGGDGANIPVKLAGTILIHNCTI